MLQIVTKGRNILKILFKSTYFLAFALLLNSCVANNQPVDNSQPSSKVNHSVSYEAPKGRLTPEMSISRAIKYNIDNLKKQITPTFIGKDAGYNLSKNLQKIQENEHSELAKSLKELDFAILYTSLNISSSPQEKGNNILIQATAQNITLATLKAHEAAYYSHKKLFEYNRLKRQYQNQIASIIKKKQNISPEEIEYQRQLEENIDKLSNYILSAEQNINDFYLLTKIEKSKTVPEGRNFYEKNILLPQYNAENYIKTAFEKREDISFFTPHSFEEISLILADQDIDFTPPVSGFYIPDTAFEQKLSINGSKQASQLLKAFQDYQKSGHKKQLSTLSEEFYKAVYWQIQIAYQLAKHISADYDVQLRNIQQLKNNLRKLEKTTKATPQQRLDLLKIRMDILENENIADQIFTERTMTAVALQFYSGLLQVKPEDLNQNTDYIATVLLKNFQNKPSSSIIHKPSYEKSISQEWAHGNDWLEELMSAQQKPVPTQLMSKQKNKDYNQNSTMILGSFLDTLSADKEWIEMKKLCPELEQYTPTYEKTSAAGITLFRLIVKYPTGGFKNVCICLRNHNKECFLQD